MKFQLRKYHPEDAAALLALFYDTVHEVNLVDYSLEQLNAWAPRRSPVTDDWQRMLQESETVVAFDHDSLIGFGNLEKGGTAIGMLYVSRRYLGKGVGKAILKKLEKKLRKKGIATAHVEVSITARPFFEAMGYSHVRDNEKVRQGVTFRNFVMNRKLKLKKKGAMKEKESTPFRWRELFTNKAFDLMIVILGVSIAFQLNNWKMASDQQSLERFYKESLLKDVNADIAEIHEIIDELNEDKKYISSYLPRMESLPADSLVMPLLAILSLETFTGNQDTYQTLVSGSGLSTFANREIVEKITKYYSTYTSIRRFETVYTEAIFEINRHFAPYVIYDQMKIADPSVARLPATRNFLTLANAQVNSGLEDYEDALAKAMELRKAIEESR